MNRQICNQHLTQADMMEEQILCSKHYILLRKVRSKLTFVRVDFKINCTLQQDLNCALKLKSNEPPSTQTIHVTKKHPVKEWSYVLPEIQKLQGEKECIKNACSKGQRTAEKLAKENHSLHNEIQGW